MVVVFEIGGLKRVLLRTEPENFEFRGYIARLKFVLSNSMKYLFEKLCLKKYQMALSFICTGLLYRDANN